MTFEFSAKLTRAELIARARAFDQQAVKMRPCRKPGCTCEVLASNSTGLCGSHNHDRDLCPCRICEGRRK